MTPQIAENKITRVAARKKNEINFVKKNVSGFNSLLSHTHNTLYTAWDNRLELNY